MLLSVCIVNWNTCDFLRECLHSLRRHPPLGWDMEIVVVDNASHDGSALMVNTEFPKALLIVNADNKGYAEGNNQAIVRARGEAILLLNPDVVVHQNALTQALAFLMAHPNAAAVGVRLLDTNGKTQKSLRGFPDPWPVLWEAVGLARLLPGFPRLGAYRMTTFDYNRPGEADQPMGSFLLLARRALDEVGLLDTQFPIFFNEVDWCWRAKREHGWKIYYTPDAVVTHWGGGSTRQVKPAMRDESHRALMRFYRKHYAHCLSPRVFRLCLALMEGSRRRFFARRISHD